MTNAGINTKRVSIIVLAVALSVSVLLLDLTGGEASAQNESPLDLELAINPLPVFIGQEVTFTITETNNSDETFPEVAVRDWLPENGTEYVSATPSQGEASTPLTPTTSSAS